MSTALDRVIARSVSVRSGVAIVNEKQDARNHEEISRELVKAIAEEIGRSTVAYVEVMYPEAIKATSSTFKLSLRNHIHNEIVAMAKFHDEASMRSALTSSAAFRKQWVAQWRKIRRMKK